MQVSVVVAVYQAAILKWVLYEVTSNIQIILINVHYFLVTFILAFYEGLFFLGK